MAENPRIDVGAAPRRAPLTAVAGAEGWESDIEGRACGLRPRSGLPQRSCRRAASPL